MTGIATQPTQQIVFTSILALVLCVTCVACGSDDEPTEDMAVDMATDTMSDQGTDTADTVDAAEDTMEVAECSVGEVTCLDSRTLQVCTDGMYVRTDCGQQFCDANAEACVDMEP